MTTVWLKSDIDWAKPKDGADDHIHTRSRISPSGLTVLSPETRCDQMTVRGNVGKPPIDRKRPSTKLPRNQQPLRSPAMSDAQLESVIEAAWEKRDEISTDTQGEVRVAVEEALDGMDSGAYRVATPTGDHQWTVNQWLKKAVLLSFRLYDMAPINGGPDGGNRGPSPWFDKVPSKFAGWTDETFRSAGFRAVPNCVVRRSAYIAPGVVLMPSFVNLGAYVDSGTMIDTWATVGSCAQIGKNCHISGGAGNAGVGAHASQSGDHRRRLLRRCPGRGGRGCDR